jgi:hypothetical protein
LDVLDGRRALVQGNQLALTNGQRQSISYKMVYRADATRDSQYQWRLGARSSTALEITGTTGVGPVRGIIQDRNPAQLQIKAPRSLIGRREWLRFDVLKDGAVVHETYLFLNVR